MKKQVLAYVKPARELKAGERVLTNRMTVAEIESVEAFEDATKRPCVIAVTRSGRATKTAMVSAMNFIADETVLVVGWRQGTP